MICSRRGSRTVETSSTPSSGHRASRARSWWARRTSTDHEGMRRPLGLGHQVPLRFGRLTTGPDSRLTVAPRDGLLECPFGQPIHGEGGGSPAAPLHSATARTTESARTSAPRSAAGRRWQRSRREGSWPFTVMISRLRTWPSGPWVPCPPVYFDGHRPRWPCRNGRGRPASLGLSSQTPGRSAPPARRLRPASRAHAGAG